MDYLSRQVNGYDTRNTFVVSMGIPDAKDVSAALENYSKAWFESRRKQYLNEAFKHTSERAPFWPVAALHDMVDEIMMMLTHEGSDFGYDEKRLAADADRLKSKITLWASKRTVRAATREDVQREIRSFEAKYRYPCPDTFKSCWMNTGAYVALSYDIKYQGLLLPGCAGRDESLDLLRKLMLEIIADRDHDVDTRLFEVCYKIYKAKYLAGESLSVV